MVKRSTRAISFWSAVMTVIITVIFQALAPCVILKRIMGCNEIVNITTGTLANRYRLYDVRGNLSISFVFDQS